MSKETGIFSGITAFFRKLFGLKTEPSGISEKQEREILKLVQQNGGVISPSIIAMETSCSLARSDDILRHFMARGVARQRLNEAGAIVYEFPGLKTSSKQPRRDPAPSRKTDVEPRPPAPKPKRPAVRKQHNPSGRTTSQKPDWMKKRRIPKWEDTP